MSGHGGFSVIAGGNKPIPIELPKVGELAPGANKLGALNVEGGKNEPAVADTRLDQASRIAAKLDTMLLKAAKSVAKPVDAEALKATTAGLPKATRKAIDKVAMIAETAFQTIGKFSGRQIADALVKDKNGCFVWNERTPVGKTVKAALDAQAKLSEQLANSCTRSSPRFSRFSFPRSAWQSRRSGGSGRPPSSSSRTRPPRTGRRWMRSPRTWRPSQAGSTTN